MTQQHSGPAASPARLSRLIWVGAASLLLYCVLGRLRAGSSVGDVAQFLVVYAALFTLYTIAVATLWRGNSPPKELLQGVVRWVWLLALLFRLALIPAGLPPHGSLDALARDLAGPEPGYRTFLLYDNDVGRYLWDGHVTAAGHSPFAYSPAEVIAADDAGEPWAEELIREERWADVLDNLSYQQFGTVYPPLAQGLFRLSHRIAPGSVAAWKILLVALDLGVCWLLSGLLKRRGRHPLEFLVYAWNPLVIKEIAGSGHLDTAVALGLVAAVLALTLERPRLALGALGLAILAKMTPLLIVPLFLRRIRPTHWWPLPLVLAAGYLPHLDTLGRQAANLRDFASLWVFNPGPWGLVHWLAGAGTGTSGRAVADGLALLGTLLLVGYWTWRGDSSIERGILWVLGGYLILSATVMPWYLVWALPFALLVRCRSYLALTGLTMLSYWIYADGVEHPGWLALEWGLFFVLLTVELRPLRRSRP